MRISSIALLCLFNLLAGGIAVFASHGNIIKSWEIENSVYQSCAQGGKLIESRQYAQARDLLLKAAAYDPTSYSASVHRGLASCYKGLKQFERAIAETQAATRFNQPYEQALYDIAMLYYESKQIDHCLNALKQYIQTSRDPQWKAEAQKQLKDISLYKNICTANELIQQRRYGDARSFLNKAAASDPSSYSSDIHGDLTYVLERLGEPEQAIVEGKKALKLDPADKATVYTIGLAYQDSGNFDEAISWLKRYVSMETSPEDRQQASNFIQELSDDRAKLNPAANSAPDYLDQLKKNKAVESWPKNKLPLKVYIGSGKGVAGYRPSFKNYIIQSLDTWCKASGCKLNYKLVDNRDKADITVKWTSEPLVLFENNRDRQKAGLTTVEASAENEITSAEVAIRTLNSFNNNQPVEEGECASTAMHEIGHALGLGHSTSVCDIMYFGSSARQSGVPTKRDRATIARLYKDYPLLSFTPQSKPQPQTQPLQYLPPPAFQPPKPPSSENLAPPMFLPPPIEADEKKLEPPLFTPPPVSSKKESGAPESTTESRSLFFTPPPAK